ncbi:hypothetical protein QVD17_15921 [Tagetes erecta]|uniref:Uncharacterized protein n=1 Tax=Tagetes erecta TaxID=13708 RepID=A0AAD8KT97_TARER|nr:hypothetical protein QVD17_15921 [Tagetes erecta]
MEPVVLASLEEGTLGDSVQVRSLRNGTITRDHMTHATCKLDLMEPVALASLEEGTSGTRAITTSLFLRDALLLGCSCLYLKIFKRRLWNSMRQRKIVSKSRLRF